MKNEKIWSRLTRPKRHYTFIVKLKDGQQVTAEHARDIPQAVHAIGGVWPDDVEYEHRRD